MAATPSRHDDLLELAALYVAGALPPAEREAFEHHAKSCAECTAEIQALTPVGEWLAGAVPQHTPPPELRDRVLAAATTAAPASSGDAANRQRPASYRARGYGQTTSSAMPWLLAAASLVFATGLALYVVQLRGRVDTLDAALTAAGENATRIARDAAAARDQAASEARIAAAVSAAPDVVRVNLSGQPAAPSATAQALWSRPNGLLFTASNLPALAPGRAYQVWVITSEPNPISAGVAHPDAEGRFQMAIATPATIPQPVAIAVTEEPDGGVPAPTGQKYLVGTVSAVGAL